MCVCVCVCVCVRACACSAQPPSMHPTIKPWGGRVPQVSALYLGLLVDASAVLLLATAAAGTPPHRPFARAAKPETHPARTRASSLRPGPGPNPQPARNRYLGWCMQA